MGINEYLTKKEMFMLLGYNKTKLRKCNLFVKLLFCRVTWSMGGK